MTIYFLNKQSSLNYKLSFMFQVIFVTKTVVWEQAPCTFKQALQLTDMLVHLGSRLALSLYLLLCCMQLLKQSIERHKISLMKDTIGSVDFCIVIMLLRELMKTN